ncbi:MAG: HNH endonuclease [Armatimonadetes bacterium]|nr:HNH endonuclease [Armatimonadota bacterium]
MAELQAELSEAGEFAGATEGEVRDRTLRSVALRRGQPLFRERMLVRYGGRCAITGWSGAPALEAAHILPFCSGGADDDTNGLLLRADLHALFDVGLLAIDPVGMAVLLSPALDVTSYAAELRDARLRPADCGSPFPDLSLLRKHLTEAQRMWEDTDAA